MTQAIAIGRREASADSTAPYPYIVSPIYDWLFFLGAPALALAAAAVLGAANAREQWFVLDGQPTSYVGLGLGTLINAHLVAVVLRSHGNRTILRRHPIRFFVVPPILLCTLALNETAMLLSTVVVVFWDAYHSALQTFGLSRIYDQRRGNDAAAGRRLDIGLSLLFYVGPILGGASMLAHFDHLSDLEELGLSFAPRIPAFLQAHQRTIAGALVAGGAAFVAYYVTSYVRLARKGYRVAWPKVWLLSTTGLCSLVAWGYNPWGLAFFITNVFHSVQYLALVWWAEGDRFRKATQMRRAAPLAFVMVLLSYGVWAQLSTPDQPWPWAVAQTVALMHFWYDGFVWSVRKRDV